MSWPFHLIYNKNIILLLYMACRNDIWPNLCLVHGLILECPVAAGGQKFLFFVP